MRHTPGSEEEDHRGSTERVNRRDSETAEVHSFTHSTMDERRYTTSWDESLVHACGQQLQSCKVPDLLLFVSHDLGFKFVFLLSFTTQEGKK